MLAALAALALLLACSGGSLPNPVDGLITKIDGNALTLRTEDGNEYAFRIADPTVGVDHLRVHQRDELPVRVTWSDRESTRVATTIADAPPR